MPDRVRIRVGEHGVECSIKLNGQKLTSVRRAVLELDATEPSYLTLTHYVRGVVSGKAKVRHRLEDGLDDWMAFNAGAGVAKPVG